MLHTTRKYAFTLALALTMLVPALGSAGTVTQDLDHVFCLYPDPAGTAPWLRATFDNYGPSQVLLTLTSLGFTGGHNQFASEWFFNFNPSKNVYNLVFTPLPGLSTIIPTNFFKLANGVWADGVYGFDFRVDLPMGLHDHDTFGPGDVTTILISGINGLNPNDFNYSFNWLCTDYTSAAKIEAPNCLLGCLGVYDTISYIYDPCGATPPDPPAVPEPCTMLIMGAGLAGMAALRRRQQQA